MTVTEYREFPVCPYCGYVNHDAWELDFTSDEIKTECDSCEREHMVRQETSIVYTTYPIPDKPEGK